MALCGAGRLLLQHPRNALRTFFKHNRTFCCSNNDPQEEQIREKFKLFPGGCIDLHKQESKIALMTINNPTRMNAFSGSMMLELEERVRELETWTEGRGLIVKGAAGTFCSGSDLNAVRAISNPQGANPLSATEKQWHCSVQRDADPEGGEKYLEKKREKYKKDLESGRKKRWHEDVYVHAKDPNKNAQFRLPLISVALIEGKALGGGAELTTACDFRVMTADAVIQFVHKNMGLVPGWGGSARLVRIVGRQHALKLLAGAKKVDPDFGRQIGLIDEVLSSPQGGGNVLVEAEQWLSQLTKGSAPVIRAIKNVVISGSELSLEQALRTEIDIFGTVWGGPAHCEALAQRTKHK